MPPSFSSSNSPPARGVREFVEDTARRVKKVFRPWGQRFATKQAGADAWLMLKDALRLLEMSSDVFPPLKSAVAGFLGVVDIFEESYLISCVLA